MVVRLISETREGTVGDAISMAFGEFQSLRDEMVGWKENIQEKWSQTERYNRVEECADGLEEFADAEDECMPEHGDEMKITWTEQKKRSKKSPYPRWIRLSNATGALSSAKDGLVSVIEDLEWWVDAGDHLDASDHNSLESLGLTSEDNLESIRDSLQSNIDRMEEIIQQAESLEFPGMYG